MKRCVYLLIALGLLAGCGVFNSKKGSSSAQAGMRPLRVNIGGDPQTLDPRRARDLPAVSVMHMLFEGLTRVNPQEKAELALAEKVKISEDLLTYTFQLRSAQWSNGDLVTADDFVYAWKKVLDPSFPADGASQLYVVKGARAAKEGTAPVDEVCVRALDPWTLQVELEYPTPYFLELISFPTFFPVNHQVDQLDPHWMENVATYVCNGPFVLTEWTHYDQLVVQKNEKYWDAQTVKLPEIQMVMVKEETEYQMYEKRELDWAGSPLSVLPIDALPQLKMQNSLNSKPLLGTYFIRINTQKAPFTDVRLRKAFAYAIDREAIVEHVTQGNHIPTTGVVPLAMGLQKKPYFNDHDVGNARVLFEKSLQASHLTLKKFPELQLMYVTGERGHLIAQALQQQWFEAFGICVKLEAVERKIYYDRLAKHDYCLAASSWIADFNDPINFLGLFKSRNTGTNNTHWEKAEYAALLEDSAKIKDPISRMEILRTSEAILMSEMPVIPVFNYSMLYVNSDNVQDVVVSSMGTIDFKWAKFADVR